MKIRAIAQHREGHGGFFRAGRFWSSTQFTEAEVDEATLAVLKADPRLMVEESRGKVEPKPKPQDPGGKV